MRRMNRHTTSQQAVIKNLKGKNKKKVQNSTASILASVMNNLCSWRAVWWNPRQILFAILRQMINWNKLEFFQGPRWRSPAWELYWAQRKLQQNSGVEIQQVSAWKGLWGHKWEPSGTKDPALPSAEGRGAPQCPAPGLGILPFFISKISVQEGLQEGCSRNPRFSTLWGKRCLLLLKIIRELQDSSLQGALFGILGGCRPPPYPALLRSSFTVCEFYLLWNPWFIQAALVLQNLFLGGQEPLTPDPNFCHPPVLPSWSNQPVVLQHPWISTNEPHQYQARCSLVLALWLSIILYALTSRWVRFDSPHHKKSLITFMKHESPRKTSSLWRNGSNKLLALVLNSLF